MPVAQHPRKSVLEPTPRSTEMTHVLGYLHIPLLQPTTELVSPQSPGTGTQFPWCWCYHWDLWVMRSWGWSPQIGSVSSRPQRAPRPSLQVRVSTNQEAASARQALPALRSHPASKTEKDKGGSGPAVCRKHSHHVNRPRQTHVPDGARSDLLVGWT